eukprot:s9960_g1.t1
MSYNPLDDVPLSIRSGAKPRPSAEGVAPSSAMDFPSQFSDADFEGDSDDSDLGARHSPAPGPAQRQRFSDQLHLYLDIKTALLEPLERIQERIVAEFKADASLIAHAANLYGWDPAALAASGPPDYFMTAIGMRKDHIFLLGRPRHPLMLAALHHCFGPTLVDQQDLSGFRYMAFCEELFRVIKADRYQGAGTPLRAGWVLGFGLGPIYLLQETHEPALKTAHPKGLPNDGHCFRTAGGQWLP